MPLALFSARRLALSATLSLAVLAGCQAPVVPPAASPSASPVPVTPQAPTASPDATAQPLQWTVVEGQATFKGQPLADKTVRVVDVLTNTPAKPLGAGATTADLGESVLAVQAEGELKTDAEGRYRLSIAGLQPGAAARIVVASGESGLTTLVPGSAVAGPQRYKVATNFTVGVSPITGEAFLSVSSGRVSAILNEHSTLHAHLFSGAVALHELAVQGGRTPPPPPALVLPSQMVMIAPTTGPARPPQLIMPPQLPQLPSQLLAETDPLTGDLKLTEQMRKLLEKQQQETQGIHEDHQQQLAKNEQQAEKTQQVLTEQLPKLGEPGQIDAETLDRRLAETLGSDEARKQQLIEIERQRRLQQQLEQQKKQEAQEQLSNVLNQIQQAMQTLNQQNQQAMSRKANEAKEKLLEQLSESQRQQLKERQYTRRHQDSAVKRALSAAGSQARQSLLEMNSQALAGAAGRLKEQGLGKPPIDVPLHGTGLNAAIIDDGITVTDAHGKSLDVDRGDHDQLVSQLKQKFPTLTPRSSSGGGSSGPAAPTPTPAAVLGVVTTADAAPSETLTDISLGAAPGDMMADDEAMWVALPSRNQVLRIPHGVADQSEIEIFDLPGSPQALAQASAGVVLAICDGDTIARLDANDSTVTSHQPDGVSGLKAIVVVGESIVVANDSTVWFFLADEPVTSMGEFNAPATITGLAYGEFPEPGAPTLLVETTSGLYQQDEGVDLIPVTAVDETTDGVTEGVAKLTLLDSQYDRRLYAINRATGKLITAAWDGGIYYRDLDGLEFANVVSVDTGIFMWVATNGTQPVLHAIGLDQPVNLDFAPSKVRVDAADNVWITGETAQKIRKIRGVQIL